MTEIKVIVSDLDHTLAYHEKSKIYNAKALVHPDNIEMIQWMRDQGVLFTIATGRNASTIKDVADLPSVDLPVIANNGGMIYDMNTNEIIKETHLEQEDIIRIFKFLEVTEHTFYMYTGDDVVYWHNFKLKESAHGKGRFYSKATYTEDPYELIKNNSICKVLFTDNDRDDLSDLQNAIIASNILGTHNYITFSGPNSIEINPKEAQKGNGLTYLSEQTGIPLENFLVFGDAMNDYTMMNKAGIKVAMSNAAPELKQIPGVFITANEDHNGIANFLKAWFHYHKDA